MFAGKFTIAAAQSHSTAGDLAANLAHHVELARRVVRLQSMAPACDIVRLARSGGWPSPAVAQFYFEIG